MSYEYVYIWFYYLLILLTEGYVFGFIPFYLDRIWVIDIESLQLTHSTSVVAYTPKFLHFLALFVSTCSFLLLLQRTSLPLHLHCLFSPLTRFSLSLYLLLLSSRWHLQSLFLHCIVWEVSIHCIRIKETSMAVLKNQTFLMGCFSLMHFAIKYVGAFVYASGFSMISSIAS